MPHPDIQPAPTGAESLRRLLADLTGLVSIAATIGIFMLLNCSIR